MTAVTTRGIGGAGDDSGSESRCCCCFFRRGGIHAARKHEDLSSVNPRLFLARLQAKAPERRETAPGSRNEGRPSLSFLPSGEAFAGQKRQSASHPGGPRGSADGTAVNGRPEVRMARSATASGSLSQALYRSSQSEQTRTQTPEGE